MTAKRSVLRSFLLVALVPVVPLISIAAEHDRSRAGVHGAGANQPRALPTGYQGQSSWQVRLPEDGMRTTRVHRYTMSGRIRPLLFWFGRDDIGLARVAWRRSDSGARGYEAAD